MPIDTTRVAADLLRVSQNRAGHRDVVVISQTAHNSGRRAIDGRQRDAELGERPDLDALDQVQEHVIEQADLLFVEPVCSIEEQVRDTTQGAHPLLGRAFRNRRLQFCDQRLS